MRIFADTHIHSCLSPCASDEMTPNNIVNMAMLKGLNLIAVTDHNTAGNLRAVLNAAEGTELCVIPGLELESSEEVHILAYFDALENAEALGRAIYPYLPDTPNNRAGAVDKRIRRRSGPSAYRPPQPRTYSPARLYKPLFRDKNCGNFSLRNLFRL